jgi:4'-phosphopantetheinyl transferase
MTHEPDVVQVWLVRDAVADTVLTDLFSLLDRDERRRADACLRAADRRRFIVAHGAARVVVGNRLGVPAGEIRWRDGPNGKPELAEPWTGVRVNLSHSGGMSAVAVSPSRAVGVDIQRTTPGLDVAAMANRYFHTDEVPFVVDARAELRDGRFAQLWARKEAILKAAGGRLMQGMRVRVLDPGGVVDFCDAESQGQYRWADVSAPAGFRAAVALSGNRPYEVVERWWSPLAVEEHQRA